MNAGPIRLLRRQWFMVALLGALIAGLLWLPLSVTRLAAGALMISLVLESLDARYRLGKAEFTGSQTGVHTVGEPVLVDFERPGGERPGGDWVGIDFGEIPAQFEGLQEPGRTRFRCFPPRGVYDQLEFRQVMRSRLGTFMFVRDYAADADLVIAPRRADIDWAPPSDAGVSIERGDVREAEPGDPRRMVHWPSTAKAARLMVRTEHRLPDRSTDHLDVVVELAGDATDEVTLSRARGYADTARERGWSVEVLTAEGRSSDVMRALAGATAGAAPEPHAATTSVRVTSGGDRWVR